MNRTFASLAAIVIVAGAGLVAYFGPWFRPADAVTIYTSVDQVYAEPILQAFTEKTGIKVNALYDAEAAKTVGLVNRLIAEKSAPLADVFWNGEFMQTLALKDEGVLGAYTPDSTADLPERFLDSDGAFVAFGGRARVLIVNTALLAEADRPQTLADIVARPGETAIANPLFGSTFTHAAALAAALGVEPALQIFADLKSGGARVVDGNAVVRDMVAAGQVPMGLTDTDDACVAIEKGAEVAVIFPDQAPGGLGTLVVPNTVALIAGAPHDASARLLIDYLVAPETEATLIASGWVQIPSRPGLGAPRCYGDLNLQPMQVAMPDISAAVDAIGPRLRDLFQN